jgi:predicted RND superfamily exporter protein
MWAKLSHLILRNRVSILIVMGLISAFMIYEAKSNLALSYKYARVLPVDDSLYIDYEAFKARYGEDGNVLILGFQDSTMFQLKKFQDWCNLGDTLKKIEGIQDVMSTGRLYNVVPNDSLQKFEYPQIVQHLPKTQEEADSIKKVIYNLPAYEGLIINKKDNVTVMAVTFTQKELNTKNRLAIVANIKEKALAFGKANHVEMHFSGMPYIRTEYMRMIGGEGVLFLLLSIFVTAFILFIFFRYFNAVFFSLIVVLVGLAWSLGTIALLDYKITILTSLIPSLIVIIGIPNCIFLINKYQEELLKHGNKTKALSRMIQKVGLSNFLANLTTAIGFGVFYFTNSSMLVEFGVVAAINVMTTYFIALILTPIIFSYLPEPKPKQMKHLEGKRINKIMDGINKLVHEKRRAIYIGVAVITLISVLGFMKIKVNGYVVDDLPKDSPIYTDLKFFEKHFNGILPFEIALEVKPQLTQHVKDSLAKRGIVPNPHDYAGDTLGPKDIFDQDGDVLDRINALQSVIGQHPEFSKPVSVVEAVKFAYQALKDGKKAAYKLPNNLMDKKEIVDYFSPKPGEKIDRKQQQKLSAFLDSTHRFTRISIQMADVGSDSAKRVFAKIVPAVDSLFPSKYFKVDLTGNSRMFLRSFDYMLHHLFVSLLIAILLILILGMVLFRSVWIIVLSKLPCLIPLVITAGIMGFLGIPFKSSTILIFSIAFGIASDGTIYILTEYRHQLRKLSPSNYSMAVSNAIHETGVSMVYTNTILFFGFAIFVLSSFGGTVALGILLSITLIVSLATNLILLPCILLSLEKRAATKAFLKEPLIEIYDEEEDIDSDKLIIETVKE